MQIEPHSVTIGFRGAPGPIGVASGNIIVQPDVIKLEKVSARATGGTADFDGELQISDGGVQTRGLRIDMHQMPIERWLEGLVDPDDFSATGNVGGDIVITGDRANGFLANGKLTLQNGRVQLGFLALADFRASRDRDDSRPHTDGIDAGGGAREVADRFQHQRTGCPQSVDSHRRQRAEARR